MKHEAIITFDRAVCRCGQMRSCWRTEGEAIGAYTLRAHEVWLAHVAKFEEPATLFDLRDAVPEAVGLFS